MSIINTAKTLAKSLAKEPEPIALGSVGVNLPICGLGTSQIEDENELHNVIENALEVGYRHFDTALLYKNERAIGKALSSIFKQGKYRREDVFLTTKLPPLKKINAVEACRESLQELQTEYVDALLVHWPCFLLEKAPKLYTKAQHEFWSEIEQCEENGLAKCVGVANFNVQSLTNILSLCKVKPALCQFEVQPYHEESDLIYFCKKFAIEPVGYSPFAKGGNEVPFLKNHVIDIFKDEVLESTAEKYERTIAQIVLNYLYYELGVAVIPKTVNKDRLVENFSWFDFRISAEDVEKIRALDRGLRILDTRVMIGFGGVNIFA